MRRIAATALFLVILFSGLHFIVPEASGLGEGSDVIRVGPDEDFTSVSQALKNASAGDTIVLVNSTYRGSLVLDRAVTLMSEYEHGAVIIGTEDVAIKVTADYVTIEDLRIEAGDEGTSILVEKSTAAVKNCIITGGANGIVLGDSDNCLIENNTIKDLEFPGRTEIAGGQSEIEISSVLDLDPVALWSFEEESWSNKTGVVRDSSGNGHHGDMAGYAYPFPNGKMGRMGVFDGRSRLIMGTHSDLDISGGITMSAWIKTTSGSYYQSIIDKHHHVTGSNPHSEQGYSLYLDDGNARITIYSDSDQRSAKGNTDVRDGQWHHILGTYDGERIGIYVDGVLQKMNNWSYPMTKSSAKLTIGERIEGWGGYMTFRGSIDEVTIFDKGFNRTEARDLHDLYQENTTSTPTGDLVGYWNFDQPPTRDLEIEDFSGYSNTGKLVNGGGISEGKEDRALYLSGGGEHMRVFDDDSLDLTDSISVSSWVRTSSTNYYQCILDKLDHNTASGYTFYLDDGRIRLSVYTGDGEGTVIGTSDLRDGMWHHVAGIYDGSKVKVYVDGKLENEKSWSKDAAINNNNVGIGRRMSGWGGYLPFEGRIDEIRLYKKALTYSEVEDLHIGATYSALRLSSSDSSMIKGNDIESNEVGGILLLDSDLNRIDSNYLSGNHLINLRIDRQSSKNLITDNIFQGSGSGLVSAIDNGVSDEFDKSGRGNYWYDWSGPDSNNDGIVDIQYLVNGTSGTRDRYPLTGVNNSSRPPAIITTDVTTAEVAEPYSVKYTASDPDTPTGLSWTMSTNASWLSFTNRYLNGTPVSVGSFWVAITVSDGENSDSTNFTISVRNGSGNYSGPLSGETDVQIDEDTQSYPLLLTRLFGDDSITPDDVEVSSDEGIDVLLADDGEVVIRPRPDWYGSGEVVIRSKDSNNGMRYRINVVVLPKNDPPEIGYMSIEGRPVRGQNFKLRSDATDVDSEYLTYSWWIEGEEITYSGQEIMLNIESSGEITVWLNVEDDQGGEDLRSFSIDVNETKNTNEMVTDDVDVNYAYAVIGAFVIVVMISMIIASIVIVKNVRKEELRHPVSQVQIDRYRGEKDDDVQGIKRGYLDGSSGEQKDYMKDDLERAYRSGRISRETYDIIRDEIR